MAIPVATKPTKASSVGFVGCLPGHFQETPSPAGCLVPIVPIAPILESVVLAVAEQPGKGADHFLNACRVPDRHMGFHRRFAKRQSDADFFNLR
jgi:hypothetical protein